MQEITKEKPAKRRKRGWMKLRVTAVEADTHDTKTFYLEDAEEGGRPFDYDPGQYLTIRIDGVADKPVVRSYTMSSSPNQGDFSALTIKRVEHGLVSNWFCDEVQPETILKAMGPIGKFVFDPQKDHPHLVMVAAGSGVTPFVSILREYANCLGEPGAPERMTLLVSYRSRQDLIRWHDLETLAAIDGINIATTLTREKADGFLTGRPDEAMLANLMNHQYDRATYMTCGPQQMMDMVCNHLSRQGVPADHIKTEAF